MINVQRFSRDSAVHRPALRRSLLPVLVALAALGFSAVRIDAQDDRAAGRDIVKKWQGAIINVRVVLKMRVSVGGREMQSMDESVETVGTVIDPSGLTVLSLGALNPGAMMNKMLGGGGSSQERMEFGSEPSDVKLRLPDGKELPARIVLRDEDLDLAFLRPISKPDKPLVAIDLKDEGRPSLLDPVVVLSRLGRVGGLDAGRVAADHRRYHRAAAHVLCDRDRLLERCRHAGVHHRGQGRGSVDDAIGVGRQAGDVLDGGWQRRPWPVAGHSARRGRARDRATSSGEIARPPPGVGASSAGSALPRGPRW